VKVTAIKRQIKQSARYSIYVDEKYSFSLSESELLDTKLLQGQEITAEQLENFQARAKAGKAFNQALELLAYRARSEWEIREYLKRKDYEPTLIDAAISKLAQYGYVDDRAFARQWVESRRLLKAASKRRLQQELRQKHIADEVVTIVLDESETDDRQALRQLIDKKRSRYPDKLKLMQYLMRQGYNYDDIKQALRDD
jgi:regulatory protein